MSPYGVHEITIRNVVVGVPESEAALRLMSAMKARAALLISRTTSRSLSAISRLRRSISDLALLMYACFSRILPSSTCRSTATNRYQLHLAAQQIIVYSAVKV